MVVSWSQTSHPFLATPHRPGSNPVSVEGYLGKQGRKSGWGRAGFSPDVSVCPHYLLICSADRPWLWTSSLLGWRCKGWGWRPEQVALPSAVYPPATTPTDYLKRLCLSPHSASRQRVFCIRRLLQHSPGSVSCSPRLPTSSRGSA